MGFLWNHCYVAYKLTELIWIQAMSESITSICGGCVSSSGYDEVIAATYAGWVLGLTTEPQQKEAGPTTATQEPISEEVQARIDNLRLVEWYSLTYKPKCS